MSLRGYVAKTRRAPWTRAFPATVAARTAKSKRLRSRSKRQQRRTAAYVREARAFVAAEVAAGKTCPVVAAVPELRNGFKYGHPISARITQVHHTRGRLGPLLMDKRGWRGVSAMGHRWIDANREAARALGFLCQRGDWHRPFD